MDAYHALNVVPLSLEDEGLTDAFVVGGGYKYCQLGEGNCFLRLPRDTELATRRDRLVQRVHGAGRLRSAPIVWSTGKAPTASPAPPTIPTSHYRAAAVFDFFRDQGLTVDVLREVSQHQIGLLATTFDDLDLAPGLITRDRGAGVEELGGFLALRSPIAGDLVRRLRAGGMLTDARGDVLRLGPAPYLSDRQLKDAVALLGEAVRAKA